MMPTDRPPVNQLSCPTCGARQAWSDTCRRCRCDLQLVVGILHRLHRLRKRCLRELYDQQYDRAAATARRCCRLDASPENQRLLAVAQSFRGQFAAAVRLLSP